ncbi:hypothetical protein AAFF_G00338000 [Aldrovandia affinis]|uniref:Uncharacterized protein n=1 Tax=Aldrovandia affinis TaxID=143900 RepID=A0AAD7WPT0_9TELE|nr:hypothetical protein AAFF_G00338000 [Aldrovandia affinis]
MKILNQNSKFIQIFAAVGTLGRSMSLFSVVLKSSPVASMVLVLESRKLMRQERLRSRRFVAQASSRQGLSVDLSTFPPCKRVLLEHMKRVNFQVCVWKRAHEHYPEIPSPLDHGFHINSETGKLEPLWFEGDVIPKALVDVLAEEDTDEDDIADEIHTMDDDEEEDESDDD